MTSSPEIGGVVLRLFDWLSLFRSCLVERDLRWQCNL